MRALIYSIFLIVTLFFSGILHANTIVHMKIDGAISPATSKYLDDAMVFSKANEAQLLLIEMDTPGGLATSMREMIKTILNSSLPVVIYVSPKGARAASAGTFLIYASHIAAMSPGTNIGAATPVNLMDPTSAKPKEEKGQGENKKEDATKILEDKKSAIEKKVLNDSIAYIKSIAELRGRNIQWAIDAVKEGKSISAKEAKDKKVIEYISNDVEELLVMIDAQKIRVDKKLITLDTKNANLVLFQMDWKTQLLMVLSNPNIAYVFLILAMYGIIFEMMNPGSIFPGVIGVTSAIFAMYALNILPFNYAGLLLMILGVLFMIGELFLVGFGIMGVVGVVAFAFGSILLFDEKTIGLAVSKPLIIAVTVVSLGFFVWLLGYILKLRKQKSTTGENSLIGTYGSIIELKDKHYKVMLLGEIWNARSELPLKVGDKIVVDSVDGLTLHIRSIE